MKKSDEVIAELKKVLDADWEKPRHVDRIFLQLGQTRLDVRPSGLKWRARINGLKGYDLSWSDRKDGLSKINLLSDLCDSPGEALSDLLNSLVYLKETADSLFESAGSIPRLARIRAAVQTLAAELPEGEEGSDYIVQHLRHMGIQMASDGACSCCGGRTYIVGDLNVMESPLPRVSRVKLYPCTVCNRSGHAWIVATGGGKDEPAQFVLRLGEQGTMKQIGEDDPRWCVELE